jgi:hypothetical protein
MEVLAAIAFVVVVIGFACYWIWWAFSHFPVQSIAATVLLGIAAYYIRAEKERKKALKAQQQEAAQQEQIRLEQERARIAEQERIRKEQEASRRRLQGIVADSKVIAAGLPALVYKSQQALDKAEFEFKDGAFAPFWDAVEGAAAMLATFTNQVQMLDKRAEEYRVARLSLIDPPPVFDLGLQTFPDALRVVERLNGIVRTAQKNFHFASIYESRKTNQLLVAGFTTLAQALNDLGEKLHESLDRFCSTAANAIGEMKSEQNRSTLRIVEELQRTSASIKQAIQNPSRRP